MSLAKVTNAFPGVFCRPRRKLIPCHCLTPLTLGLKPSCVCFPCHITVGYFLTSSLRATPCTVSAPWLCSSSPLPSHTCPIFFVISIQTLTINIQRPSSCPLPLIPPPASPALLPPFSKSSLHNACSALYGWARDTF